MSSPAKSSDVYQSPFQLFIKGIQDLYPDKSIKSVLEKYPVPQLVMIGSESTGKSSVLENITKTEIFPTNQQTCTRCPIKVVMIPADNGEVNSITVEFRGQCNPVRDQASLKSKMEELFELIRTTSTSGYCDDVVTVTLVHPNVVRIDLVDLPGIVSYPPQARDFTTNMCLRYIRDPNSFLICVANATIPRLNSYEPIARILENNAQDRTIIVLTMADKLRPEDYTSQLTNRLKMTTDELMGGKFLACCAVVNRGSQEVQLPDQPGAEQLWFQEHLLACLTEKEGASLIPHLGIAQLQLQVNKLYEKYLKDNWLPRIVADIQATVLKREQEITDLGKVVDASNLLQFQEVLFRCQYLSSLQASLRWNAPSAATTNTGNSGCQFFGQMLTMQDILNLTYAKRTVETLKESVRAIDFNARLKTLASGPSVGLGQDNFARDWKPWRFGLLWRRVMELLCEVIDKTMSKAFIVLQPVLLQQLLVPPQGNQQRVDYADCVIHQSFAIFIDACKEQLFAGKGITIVREDPVVAKQRADLQSTVAKYGAVKEALQASAQGKPASPAKRAGKTD